MCILHSPLGRSYLNVGNESKFILRSLYKKCINIDSRIVSHMRLLHICFSGSKMTCLGFRPKVY